jgi:uncharacterized membrane protein YhaH (DUF805 family)
MLDIGFRELAVIVLIVLILTTIYRPIIKKAGYSGWWAILIIIPVVNVILIWVFALVTWPAEAPPRSKLSIKDHQ